MGALLALAVLLFAGLAIVFNLTPDWRHFELILIAALALALLLGPVPLASVAFWRRSPPKE